MSVRVFCNTLESLWRSRAIGSLLSQCKNSSANIRTASLLSPQSKIKEELRQRKDYVAGETRLSASTWLTVRIAVPIILFGAEWKIRLFGRKSHWTLLVALFLQFYALSSSLAASGILPISGFPFIILIK